MQHFLRYLIFLTLCLSFSEVTSNYTEVDGRSSMYHGYKVFMVTIASEKDIRVLKNLEKNYKDGVQAWSDYYVIGDLVIFQVKTDCIHEMRNMLTKHNVTFKVYKAGMEQIIRREINKQRDNRYEEFGYNYAKHNPFEAMISLLKGLTSKYRRISRLEVAGSTVEGRPIFAVHISKTRNRRKPTILIECGAHAREWSAFEVCFYFISELLKQKTEKVKRITSKYHFVIMPALNPDGYVYTWTKDRMWRKNRSCNLPKEKCKGKCIGVDVNRNFDVEFCQDGVKTPCSEIYCGSSAFSERESKAVKRVAAKLRNRLLAYFCFHAFMSVWAFPYAKTKELPRNYKDLERVAKVAVDTLQKRNNTVYKTGSIANVIYGVSGSSLDYAYESAGAQYAFVIELRQGKQHTTGFIMNENEILPLCQETFPALVSSILAMRPHLRG